jgi:malonyl CoA-acyl carrier protein transacylase/acyl carrier protein
VTTVTGGEPRESAPADPRGKTALVFSGQGNQWLGMGRQLLAQEPVVRDVLTEADDLLRARAGWSLLDELVAGPEESALADPGVLQPVLVALQIALARLLAERGVVADACTGHSLGEISAAAAAGALSLADAVELARLRGELMRRAVGTGKTALLGLDAAEAAARIARHGGSADVAAWNAPRSTLIAGDVTTVAAVVDQLAAEEVFARQLPGDIAFHSSRLTALGEEFAGIAAAVTAHDTVTPLVSTVTGDLVDGALLDGAHWGRNLRAPVHFLQAVDTLLALGCTTFVEVGAHPTLTPSIADCCAERGLTPLVLPTLRRGEDEQESLLHTVWQLRQAGAVRRPARTSPPVVSFRRAVLAGTRSTGARSRAPRFAAETAEAALTALDAIGALGSVTVRWQGVPTDSVADRGAVTAAPLAPGATSVAVHIGAPGTAWTRIATARATGPAAEPLDADRTSLADLVAHCTEELPFPGGIADAAWRGDGDTLVRLGPRARGGDRRALLETALRAAADTLGLTRPEEIQGVRTAADPAGKPGWAHLRTAAHGGEQPRTEIRLLDAGGRELLALGSVGWQGPGDDTAPAAQPDAAPAGPQAAPVDLAALLAEAGPARLAGITEWVRAQAAEVLRTTVERIPADEPVNRLGMDSVMGLELRRRLKTAFGVELSLVRVLRGATPADLAADIADELAADLAEEPAEEAGAAAPPDLDNPDDIERLLADVDNLSPEEVDSLLGRLASGAAGEL